MNEKDKKSLIIISSVFIFVLVFMAFFTFYRRDSMLSNRTIPKIDTNIPIQEVDPPSHGDTCSSVTRCYCDGQLISGDQCSRTIYVTKCTSGVNAPNNMCCPGGSSWDPSSNACRKSDGTTVSPTSQTRVSQTSYYNATCNTETTCTACDFGKYLNGTQCSPCPAGKYCAGGDSQPRDIKCEDYDSVAECPSTCHAWGGGCHTNPKPEDTIHCCVNGEYKPSITRTECSNQGGSVVSGSSQCSSEPPIVALKCYKIDNNQCTEEWLSGTQNCSGSYYENEQKCLEALGSTQFDCSSIGDSGSCNSGQAATYCSWCVAENKCKTKGASCSAPSSSPSLSENCNTYCSKNFTAGSMGYSDCMTNCNSALANVCCDVNGKFSYMSKAACLNVGTEVSSTKCSSGSSTTIETKTCVKYSNNKCSYVSIKGTSCTGENLYSLWSDCAGENIKCKSDEYISGNSCLRCESGHVKSNNCVGSSDICCEKPDTKGCAANTYCTKQGGCTDGVGCVACPNDYFATADNTTCHKYIAPGSCPAGSYTAGGVAAVGENLCISCGAGKSSATGATSAADCYSLEGVTSDDCVVTTTTKARDVSYHGGNGNSDGSIDENSQGYYVVEVHVDGKGCKDQELTFNYDNTEGTGKGTYKVYDGFKMDYIVRITDQKVCDSTASVTAVLKDDNGKVTSTSNPATVSTSTDWNLTERATCVDESFLIENGENSRNSAENEAKDLYYIVLDQTVKNADGTYTSRCPDGKLMVDVWTRGCETCGGTPPTIPTSSTSTPSLVYACYGNGRSVESSTSTTWAYGSSSTYPYYLNGVSESECHPYGCYTNGSDYKWSNSAPSGYTKVNNVLAQSMCKNEEDACYLDSTGEYKWGKYKNNPGYTLVTSIVESSKCKKIENPACYTDGEIYLWDNTQPGSGFHIVDNINSSTDCHPYEKPACYYYNDGFVWGQYATKSGYNLVGGIEEKEYCNAGCYVNKNNEYIWGNYSGNNDYTLVIGITDRIKCGVTPDVPKTDLNVQTIVYVAVAVMSVAGIYFVVRYNNKSKKI